MNILDGKATSKAIQLEIAEEVIKRVSNGFKKPHLAAVLIGVDGASQTYVNSKVKACERCGFDSTLVQRPADVTEAEVLQIVDDLNNNDSIDGFIVQLP
ncbi:MAG: methylenetetrahydrofolate dehydrogenase (NADP+)/methenyltetrahydrofolate cyclohydrolase, partial [Flavobacteriales bacterium]